jgi:hydrogenase nickel incorporation protein HypA/HybF
MHEQSIVEALLAKVLEEARKEEAKKVLRVYLVIGELSGVLTDAVDFYFSFLSRDTIAADASLVSRPLRCVAVTAMVFPRT